MKNENIWPRLIGQYRKRHALTQEDFAKRFGVTQQTVSRWEAGQQAPGLDVQTTLRTALGLGALSDSQAWIARVNETFGREALFDQSWRVVAISDEALKHTGIARERALGRRIGDIIGVRESSAILERVPLFDGKTRALKVSIELLLPTVRLRRDVDLWPIVTTDDKLFIHLAAFEVEMPQPRSGDVHINLIGAQLLMLDGTIVPIGSRAVAL
ncbi:MAG: helix-turn-helix transcriptional regulator [Alphaproteobacteria bacterium]|nr:helix-turn-helix transcriptional regulator [Alphaproteobacteria bacterium]